MNDDGKSVVLQTMKEFASSLEVQSLCCHVLGNTAVTGTLVMVSPLTYTKFTFSS